AAAISGRRTRHPGSMRTRVGRRKGIGDLSPTARRAEAAVLLLLHALAGAEEVGHRGEAARAAGRGGGLLGPRVAGTVALPFAAAIAAGAAATGLGGFRLNLLPLFALA